MKIRIKKLEELPNALYPKNIEIGYEREYEVTFGMFRKPRVGEAFLLAGTERYFRTSIVEEIIDENTFRTLNSIYRWEKLDV